MHTCLYFQLDQRQTCVDLEAHRWYPVANMTIQHKMRVYDYYEPGKTYISHVERIW